MPGMRSSDTAAPATPAVAAHAPRHRPGVSRARSVPARRRGFRRSAHRRSRHRPRWCWRRQMRRTRPCAPAPAAGAACAVDFAGRPAVAPGAAPRRPAPPGAPGSPVDRGRRATAAPRRHAARRCAAAEVSASTRMRAAQQLQHAQADVAAADDQQARSALEASGGAVHGAMVLRAQCCASLSVEPEFRAQVSSSKHPMSFHVTLMPSQRSFEVQRDEPILSAAIRQGIGLPYGCRDGACGSCKSRLVRRPRDPRRAPVQGPERRRGRCRLDPAVLRRRADRLRDRSAHRARRGRVPGAEDAGARAEPAARSRRCDDHEAAAAGQRRTCSTTPASTSRSMLRDGARRSYSMANAPHNLGEPPALELHLRHLPGGVFTDTVFTQMKERNPAHRNDASTAGRSPSIAAGRSGGHIQPHKVRNRFLFIFIDELCNE